MPRKLWTTLMLSACASLPLLGQPVVNEGGVLNSASYANARLATGAIAQGSIFVIFGARIGPAALVQAPSLPLQTTLGGTSVTVVSGGQTLNCPMVYASAGQVAAIMPSTTPVGNATLTVSFNGASSAARTVRVAASSFGTFAINQRGSGPGVVTNFDSPASQPVNTVLKPARNGQTVTLYGTGLGPLPAGTPDNAAAPAVQINNNSIEVLVGSTRATVTYAGRAPGFVGLDQINFVVPEGVSGCAVGLIIRVGTAVSNLTTIAVSATGGVCSDPLGLPSSLLERLQSGASVKVGNVSLTRADLEFAFPGFGTQNIKNDSGDASFVEYTPQTVVSSSSLNANGLVSIGGCLVYTAVGLQLRPVDPAPPRGMDAGAQLVVNGPRGTKNLTRVPNLVGSYSGVLAQGGIAIPFPGAPQPDPPFLEAGNYTITGTGGADVGAFTAQYTITAPLVWTNKAAISTVTRANGQLVTWTGGGPNDYVSISGYSAAEASENTIYGFFSCVERASVGRFTIPPAVLLSLPPTPSGDSLSLPFGTLGVGLIGQERTFNAPGLDLGVTTAVGLITKSASYN